MSPGSKALTQPGFLRCSESFRTHLQLYLQECIFTDVGTGALADVLVVNNHIHSIDVRGCKGERFESFSLFPAHPNRYRQLVHENTEQPLAEERHKCLVYTPRQHRRGKPFRSVICYRDLLCIDFPGPIPRPGRKRYTTNPSGSRKKGSSLEVQRNGAGCLACRRFERAGLERVSCRKKKGTVEQLKSLCSCIELWIRLVTSGLP